MRIEKEILIESISFKDLPMNPAVLSLVDFLRSGGSVPPIKVQKGNDGFILLDGRHRLAAFKLLGHKTINAKFSTKISTYETVNN
jgi:ParB-like chromosome segregation protein Spo0J